MSCVKFMKDFPAAQNKIIKNPVLNIALYQPEIPANTGNIARLCGAAELRLHLIHPLGFKVEDRHLKRAGLDYWNEIDIRHHADIEAFFNSEEGMDSRLVSFSSHADLDYTKANIENGYFLLFGKESVGLPSTIKKSFPCYKIPIWGKVRSLNLSTAVGIVTYHYLHQLGCF